MTFYTDPHHLVNNAINLFPSHPPGRSGGEICSILLFICLKILDIISSCIVVRFIVNYLDDENNLSNIMLSLLIIDQSLKGPEADKY